MCSCVCQSFVEFVCLSVVCCVCVFVSHLLCSCVCESFVCVCVYVCELMYEHIKLLQLSLPFTTRVSMGVSKGVSKGVSFFVTETPKSTHVTQNTVSCLTIQATAGRTVQTSSGRTDRGPLHSLAGLGNVPTMGKQGCSGTEGVVGQA